MFKGDNLSETRLSSDDLIRDEPLDQMTPGHHIPDELDLLNHRSTARKVAELCATADRHMNVAVFGPWGAGKSSFFGLLEEELSGASSKLTPIRFDAWQNAGAGFQANFLATLASKLGEKGIEDRLFSVKRKVHLPFGLSSLRGAGRVRAIVVVVVIVALVFLVGPLIFSLIANIAAPVKDFPTFFRNNALSWAGFGASGSVVVIVATLLLNLTKVDIEESTPSHVAHFRGLFDELMQRHSKKRYAILIDELDRCAPEDVMLTLEGLRTFLGHDQCVFVVAFDRAAITETIAKYPRNMVPLRADAPYYATAGEYLDKIFQFQVALPPQPLHVARRFALSLVMAKKGVWGELRAQGNDQLERVVRILSPIHLRSPRRTKVLLNDFAVNARVYQALNFDWLTRCEEIAAWTVIQTEFPRLARDVEMRPQALKDVIDRAMRDGEDASSQNSYRDEGGLVETADDVVSSVTSDSAPGPEIEEEEAASMLELAHAFNSELSSYLRKLNDMGCPTPRADLILMHSDGALLSFEDIDVYNALQDIDGISRADAVAMLLKAGRADRAAALRFMLEQLETPSGGSERENLGILCGEVSNLLDRAARAPFTDELRRLFTSTETTGALSRLPRTAVIGLSKAFADAPESEVLSALRRIEDRRDDVADILVEFTNELTDEQMGLQANELLGLAEPKEGGSPAVFGQLLWRADAVGAQLDVEELAETLARSFKLTQPEPTADTVQPRTAIVINAATEADALATQEYETSLELSEARLRSTTATWSELREDGEARQVILATLRTLGEKQKWAASLHDELLTRDVDASRIRQTNIDYLVAIAKQPWHAAARWISKIQQAVSVPSQTLVDAVSIVAQRGLDGDDDAVFNNALNNLIILLGLTVDEEELDISIVVSPLETFVHSASWDSVTPAKAEWAFKLLELLSTNSSTRQASQDGSLDLFQNLVARLTNDQDQLSTMLKAVALLPTRTLARAVETTKERWDLRDETSRLALGQILIALQCRGGTATSVVPAIPAADVIELDDAGVVEIIRDWLETSPSAQQVTTVLNTQGMQRATTKQIADWAAKVGEQDRSELWQFFADRSSVDLATAAAGTSVDEAKYVAITDAIKSSSSAAMREPFFHQLTSLPNGSRAYKMSVLALLDHLAKNGAQADLSLMIAALRKVRGLSGAERGRVHSLLESWIDKYPKFLAKHVLASLSEEGLLPKRGNFIERLLGTKR